MIPDQDGDNAQAPTVAEEAAAGALGVSPASTAASQGDGVGAVEGASSDETLDAAEEVDLEAVEELEASEVIEVDEAGAPAAGAGGPSVAAAVVPPPRITVDRGSDEILAALERETPLQRVEVLRRELLSETEAWRRAVLEHEIGVRLQASGDGDGAAAAFGRALIEDPALKPNLWTLRQLCERRGDWPNLGALIIAEARAASSSRERADLYVERGHLLGDHLGDEEAALDAFRSALAEDPESLSALFALERRALRRGDDAARRSLLGRMTTATGDPGRRAELLVELARLEAGDGEARPFDRLREALALEAAVPRVLDEAQRIADARGDWEELLTTLEQQAVAAGSGEDRRAEEQVVDLRRWQASLVRTGEAPRARGFLEKGLQRVPGHPLLLSDLAELALDEERWDDAAALLSELEGRVSPAAARRVAAERAGALRRGGRAGEAESIERSMGEAAPLVALRSAERSEQALAAGDEQAVIAALEETARVAEQVPDGRWRARVLSAVATLRERSGDLEGALTAWRAAVLADPEDGLALAALDGALAELGGDAERLPLLERRLGLAEPDAAAALLDDLVELRFDRLGDAEGATVAAEALCRLRALGGGLAEATARARLVEIERSAGRPAEAAAQLSRLARACRDGGAADEAVDAELARAELLARIGERGGAMVAIEDALRASPDHELAHAERRRLLAEAGDWEGVAASLQSEARVVTEPGRLARVLVELAQLLEGRLGRRVEAAAAWREVNERVPGVLSAAPSWHRAPPIGSPDAATLKRIEAEVAAAPASERAAGWLRIAELADAGGGAEGNRLASDAATRSLSLGGAAAAHAALVLLRTASRSDDPATIEGALETLTPFTDAVGAAILGEARATLLGRRGDVDVALAGFEEALERDPTSWSARLRSARLAAASGQPARLAAVHAATAARTTDPRLASVLAARSVTLAGRAAASTAAAAQPIGPAAVEAVLELACSTSTGGESELAQAEHLLGAGRLDEAAARVDALIDRSPRDAVVLDLARRVAHAAGDRLGEARCQHALASVVSSEARSVELLSSAASALEEQGERAEAALAWRTLARLRPEVPGHRQRARALLEELDDVATLEEMLTEELAASPGEEARFRLLVERGALRARSGRPRGAAEDLETVVGAAPDDPRALEALAALRADTGDLTAAAHLLERRLAGVGSGEPPWPNGNDRALLLRLLEHYQGLGNVDGIRATLRRLDPHGVDEVAVRARAAEVLERFGDAAGAIEQLGLVGALEKDAAARVRVELHVAVLLRDRLADLPAARAALSRALALDPLHLEALGMLMPLCVSGDDRLLRDAALLRAGRAAQASIDADPDSARGYEVLERVADWLGDEDGRQLASQAAAAVAERPIPPRRGGLEPARPLPDDLQHGAFPPEAWGPARTLWREVHEAAQRLLGADLGALGVGRHTRVNEKGVPPAWQVVDRIARALGVQSYALHAVGGPGDVCATSGDALVLGAAFGDSPGPDERFQVARKLVLLRDRLGPLEGSTDEALELFFAACAVVAEARWAEARHLPAARVEEWARVVDRTLDRRARKALQEQAAQFSDLSEVGTWRRSVLAGANRIALAVAGDLSAGLSELRLDPSSAAGRSLIRFAVSDEMAAMRRALGLRG